MSIDEAITKHKEIAKRYKILADSDELVQKSYCTEFDKYKYIKSVEEHEQLAEWLEDYKQIKMLVPIEQALKAEYNKAIDDCISIVREEVSFPVRIIERLEKLKEENK